MLKQNLYKATVAQIKKYPVHSSVFFCLCINPLQMNYAYILYLILALIKENYDVKHLFEIIC